MILREENKSKEAKMKVMHDFSKKTSKMEGIQK